jgi:eukaryotic-like serine/threonine-protein kinase
MRTAEVERRALALFEHLADDPDNEKLRARFLKKEARDVVARVDALLASARRAESSIPTLIPGAASADDMILPPERIGPFRLTTRIGRGGMGDVWAGERADGLYEQKVAIKLIQRHALARAAAAFDDERRFLAKLEHPNIARLIDGGVTEDGLPWLAMEFFDGQPIDEACAAVSLSARVRTFVKAADAVQYAHSRMVAHADLKPSNILVDPDGRVKLLDFGISGLIGEGGASLTGSGPLTREFASPERIAGTGPSVPDDVFALGKTLAWVTANAREGSSPELDAIVRKATATDEADRYGSVAELIADLDRWRRQLPVTAVPDGWRYRATKFVERHRVGVLATGIAMVLLGATSLIATTSYFRAETARERSEQRFAEVRALSRYMLFNLYDDLARQPGTVVKRTQIAETAAGYLDRLGVARDAPADLRLETARGYRRLAAIRGLPGISNLGQPDKAMQALIRARTLLSALVVDDPLNVGAMAELGWTENDLWSLRGDSAASPKTNGAARLWFDRALALAPNDAEAQLGVIATERNRAYDLLWGEDRARDALSVSQSALARLRARRWPPSLRGRATALEINLLNRVGDGLYYSDDVQGSLAPYSAADAITDAQIAQQGPVPSLLILKGENAFNISGSLQEIPGRTRESLAVADSGVAALKQLLMLGPDAAAEKKLLVLYGQQGALLEELGETAQALGPSQASVALRTRRLAANPGDPQRMRDLAIGLAPHAELLAETGKTAEACAAVSRAVALWQEIKAAGRLGAKDAVKNLPHSGTLKKNFCQS